MIEGLFLGDPYCDRMVYSLIILRNFGRSGKLPGFWCSEGLGFRMV